ncbi:uncharacterized protein PGTG_22689 [Puccinia graminis f. sp. tritici CRL 75-36-700-3]|uniref:Uncharacterized protein n=1 Tax=Puccinia graminis f. sp. tritici (strain CRL 75-36-700-3 / race SCCL) TaxID=418459 RepID=H6QVA6_PUCGT|nr:uncharacterized protein PGTG_22689 [Puccinia graminis f. sp. tritici CRL 75-36-700-3]EHS62807.1 hypothetical protein PGTG_22689 [Puccinia graminis f. sp. tritici CRL 75-36-700-3]
MGTQTQAPPDGFDRVSGERQKSRPRLFRFGYRIRLFCWLLFLSTERQSTGGTRRRSAPSVNNEHPRQPL